MCVLLKATKIAVNFYGSPRKLSQGLMQFLLKIPARIFVDIDKITLKFTWKGTRIAVMRKTTILSCCLGISQYDNPAHTQSLNIQLGSELRIPAVSSHFCFS